MKTTMLDIMIDAVESLLAVINKNTTRIKKSDKSSTFKSAIRYNDSWLAAGETKCDKEKS